MAFCDFSLIYNPSDPSDPSRLSTESERFLIYTISISSFYLFINKYYYYWTLQLYIIGRIQKV